MRGGTVERRVARTRAPEPRSDAARPRAASSTARRRASCTGSCSAFWLSVEKMPSTLTRGSLATRSISSAASSCADADAAGARCRPSRRRPSSTPTRSAASRQPLGSSSPVYTAWTIPRRATGVVLGGGEERPHVEHADGNPGVDDLLGLPEPHDEDAPDALARPGRRRRAGSPCPYALFLTHGITSVPGARPPSAAAPGCARWHRGRSRATPRSPRRAPRSPAGDGCVPKTGREGAMARIGYSMGTRGPSRREPPRGRSRTGAKRPPFDGA
mgnify:CR=1 FL=1